MRRDPHRETSVAGHFRGLVERALFDCNSKCPDPVAFAWRDFRNLKEFLYDPDLGCTDPNSIISLLPATHATENPLAIALPKVEISGLTP